MDHVQRLYLPYTVINVGWWYQVTLPRVPSGKLDHGLTFPNNTIIAGGDIPSALVNAHDVGKYVAAIISDPRTINKRVLAHTETKTQNEVHALVEKVTGEKPERTDVSDIRITVWTCTDSGVDVQRTTRGTVGGVQGHE